MLIIRQEQMAIFNRAQTPQLCFHICEFLRSEFAADLEAVSDAELLRRVMDGYRRASRYGFERRDSIAGYIVLLLMVGSRFDEHPRIREILEQKHVPPDVRFAYLEQAVSKEQWEEARHPVMQAPAGVRAAPAG